MHVMGVSSEVRESMAKHLLNRCEVVIRRQNECPELGDFAICVAGEEDYWIEPTAYATSGALAPS